ncbi:myosin-IIIa, partial [Lates japonicus]
DEYLNEEVDARMIEYEDNRPLLDLFLQKPMGMLSLLDEESRFPQGTDQTLVEKFEDNLKTKSFWRPKRVDLGFGIHHYAGKVMYNAAGFLAKNRDMLPADIVLLLRSSENELVRKLVTHPLTKTGNLAHTKGKGINTMRSPRTPTRTITFAKMGVLTLYSSFSFSEPSEQGDTPYHPRETTNMRTQTVASYFRYSLMDLLSKMVAGQPHFVRCIKPNNDRQANKFDREKVLVQLRYTGVLETAKIRRQGYSHRILFANFIKRYYILAFHAHEEPAVTQETCAAILEKAKLENWAMGKTKVFLKYYHVEHLNLMVQQATQRIILLQAYIRGWLGAKRYQRILKEREQSALVLQSAYRGHKVRKRVANDKSKAKLEAFIVQFQAVCRGYLAKKKYKEMVDEKNKAATKIQARYRGHKERKSFKRKREEKEKEKAEKALKEKPEKSTNDENASTPENEAKNEEEETKAAVTEDLDETKAAVVLQSNFRGHKERKRLEEEGKIPKKRKREEGVTPEPPKEEEQGMPTEDSVPESQQDASAENLDGLDEEKAATVLQSNFRGHRDRKKLKAEREAQQKVKEEAADDAEEESKEEEVLDVTDVVIEHKEEADAEKERLEEEQAAVKIQSNFRGYKDRKNLKANKQTAEKEAEQLQTFSKQIAKTSQEFVALQQKLNEIIQAHQSNPESNGMLFVRGKAINGYAPKNHQSTDKRLSRTPRRSQQPKTLNTPEDSTYYNLIHRSVQDDKRKPRKQDPGKLLDIDDQYYGGLSTSRSEPSISTEETSPDRMPERRRSLERRRSTDRRQPAEQTPAAASRQTRERAVTDPEPPKPATDNRNSVPRMPSTESQTEENPYDYRHLLRKTSQRRRLIKQY